MKLDPCPWCNRKPNVREWMDYDSSLMRDYHMVRVWCCWADMTCGKGDEELNWNWRKRDR